MIEMGTLTNDDDVENPDFDEDEDIDEDDNPETIPYGSADAATHDGGVPADCQQLVDAWTLASDPDDHGYWIGGETEEDIDDPNLIDMEAPSGGLFGGGIEVAEEAIDRIRRWV